MPFDPTTCGALCHLCALRDSREGEPVPSELKQAAITVVSEAPDGQDVLEGRPLTGNAGQEFATTYKLAGADRGWFNFVNVLSCRPKNNKLKNVLDKIARQNKARTKDGLEEILDPIECCRPRLLYDLTAAGATDLIVLGATAYKAVLPGPHRPIDDVAGSLWQGSLTSFGSAPAEIDPFSGTAKVDPITLFTSRSFRAVPTVHPSRVLHEQRHRDPFRRSVSRALRWFSGALAWAEPTALYQPDAAWFRDVAVPWLMQQPFITSDTETDDLEACIAGLDSVQIGTVGWACSIAFRSIEVAGRPPLYDAESARSLRESITWLLTHHPRVVGHNYGVYDYQAIEANGLQTRYDTDTVLLSRYVTPDLPNRLGYVGQYYTDVHDWKGDGKDPKDDATRWKYGLLDVVVNARIVEPLVTQAHRQMEKVARCDPEMRPLLPSRIIRVEGAGACTLVNDPVLIHDHSLQVIAREMHQLGAYVNQEKRLWCESLLRGEEAKWLVNLQDALVSAGYKHLGGFLEDEIELALREAEARGDRMKLSAKHQRMIDNRVYAEWRVSELDWNALDPGARIKTAREWQWRAFDEYVTFDGGTRSRSRTGSLTFARGTFGDRGTPKFNPRATTDVKRLLFDTWDLPPPADLDDGALYTGDPEDGERSVGDAVLRAYLADSTLSKEQHVILHALRRAKKMRSLWSRFLKRMVPFDEWEAGKLAWERKARSGDKELKEYPGFVVWPDGRARFNWNAHGTAVGRFSSGGKPARMNFQTIPDALRIVFEPEPGNVYVGADLAAIHLRIIANLWKIPSLIDDFTQDRDPHVTLARMIDPKFDQRSGQAVFEYVNGVKTEVSPWKGEAKRGRNIGKTLRYAGAYGAAVPTIHATMTRQEDDHGNLAQRDLKQTEVRAYYNAWMGKEPEWRRAWKNEVRLWREHGFLLSPILGRRADFLDGEDPNKLYNYRVLSAEGDIMGPATCLVRERLRAMGFGPRRGARPGVQSFGKLIPSFGNTGLVGQFHDAMLIECPRESAEQVKAMLTEAMNVTIPGWPVPITAEAKIGHNWKEV